jgi:hypothetical protein
MITIIIQTFNLTEPAVCWSISGQPNEPSLKHLNTLLVNRCSPNWFVVNTTVDPMNVIILLHIFEINIDFNIKTRHPQITLTETAMETPLINSNLSFHLDVKEQTIDIIKYRIAWRDHVTVSDHARFSVPPRNSLTAKYQ